MSLGLRVPLSVLHLKIRVIHIFPRASLKSKLDPYLDIILFIWFLKFLVIWEAVQGMQPTARDYRSGTS